MCQRACKRTFPLKASKGITSKSDKLDFLKIGQQKSLVEHFIVKLMNDGWLMAPFAYNSLLIINDLCKFRQIRIQDRTV
jgi:hypothetical protein